jgi:hypothetical protein
MRRKGALVEAGAAHNRDQPFSEQADKLGAVCGGEGHAAFYKRM